MRPQAAAVPLLQGFVLPGDHKEGKGLVMVSHPTIPMGAMPAAVHKLLSPRDLSQWPAEALLKVACWAATIFTRPGKRTPGMAPIGERYGDAQASHYIDPSLVTYPVEVDARTKVFRVVPAAKVQKTPSTHEALLLAQGAGFLVETVQFAGKMVYPVLDGQLRAHYPAMSCRVEPATDWLLDQLVSDSKLLGRILRAFEFQTILQFEAMGEELRVIESRLGDLTDLRRAVTSL